MIKKENFSYRKPNPALPGLALFLLVIGLVLAGCDMISNGTDYPSDGIIPMPTASPNPAARAVASDEEITLSCATEGASIYYTTDGSDPTTFSNLYSESTKPTIPDSPGDFTVKAIAMKEGLINSKVATFTYNVSANSITTPAVAKPKSTQGNKAAVGPGQKITLTCSTADASIYYTTDGSDPTKGSTLYSDDAKPEITGQEGAVTTIKAIAVEDGMRNSDIATFTYTIMMNRALAPGAVADPPAWGDSVLLDTNITLTSETEGASIYYTTNGGVPSGSSTPYSGAITIEKDTTIKAIAVMSGMTDSPVATFSYYIGKAKTPVADPPGGAVLIGTEITLTSDTVGGGASIYYTTDGKDPTTASTLYTGPISINAATIIKAIAVKDRMYDSDIATFTYTIPKSDTPTAKDTTEPKSAGQKDVEFTLTSINTGTWKVYNEPTGGAPLSDVTASFNAPTLTLTDSGDNLPVGTYYVSVTENRKLESDRLALTVDSHGIDISLVGEPPAGVSVSGNTYTVNSAGDYLVYNSDSSKTSGNIIVPDNKTVTLIFDNVTISSGAPITVGNNSTLTLLLSGENTLTPDRAAIAINVSTGSNLVINPNGQQHGDTDLAINGADNNGIKGGNITISGPIDVTVHGISGIYSNSNRIEISDGAHVSASSGAGGSAISVGNGSILITGSGTNVSAVGGDSFVGGGGIIGGSDSTITISNGAEVTAPAYGGASWGSAGIGATTGASCGTIIITDSTVTASGGGHSTGIGSSQVSICGNITINNSTVTATAGWDHQNAIGPHHTDGDPGGTFTFNGQDTPWPEGDVFSCTPGGIITPAPSD